MAEANVPYGRLKEMGDINPEFSSTDVVLVVGASDGVNPAARTDKTAPIYGMTFFLIHKPLCYSVTRKTH